MTLREIIEIASSGYADDIVLEYHDTPNDEHGDTLAEFIAIEISETYDAEATDAAQVAEASRVIENAIRDLNGVLGALYNKASFSKTN